MGFVYKGYEKACYKGLHLGNKLGMMYLKHEVKEGNLTKEEYNNIVYGTNDKEEIRKVRRNIL